MANSMKSVGTGDHHVICLHGWFGSADGWGYLPELIDDKTYTYHFPEMRGYGARASQTGEYTMREYATDALAAADEAGLESFSLVGHSMGGKVAASMMMQAPDKIRSLVGISPVAPAPVPLDADSEALFFGAAESADSRKMILDITTGNRYSDRWLSSMTAHSLDNSTVPAFSGALKSWVGDDYTAELGGPVAPILVFAGEHDPALSADVLRQTWLQMYPDVELVELAACGHYAMYETPIALVSAMEDFLDRN